MARPCNKHGRIAFWIAAMAAFLLLCACASRQPQPGRNDPFSAEGVRPSVRKASKDTSSATASRRRGPFRNDAFSAEGWSYGINKKTGTSTAAPSRSPNPRLARVTPKPQRRGTARTKLPFFLPLYRNLLPLLERSDYLRAATLLDGNASRFGKRNRLLYLLESGLVRLYAHDREPSIHRFTQADRLDEALYTRSLTRQAGTFVINDLAAPYRGEDYESVMINLFLAVGYAEQGRMTDALVEARKVDAKLTAINAQYPSGKKNLYREDAFVRWFMGMLYESNPSPENLNDAYISYRKAFRIYGKDYGKHYGASAPPAFKKDYLALAHWMGSEEFNRAVRAVGRLPFVSIRKKRQLAVLTVLHFNGKSPAKVEQAFTFPLPDGHLVRLAFPEYRNRPYRVRYSRIQAKAPASGRTFGAALQLGEPLSRIARANLANRRTRILTKAVARATAKYMAVKYAEKQASRQWGKQWGRLIGALGNAYAVFSEKADTRAWLSLPAEIRVARLVVPPGTYGVAATLYDGSNRRIGGLPLGTIRLRAGEHRFLTFATLR